MIVNPEFCVEDAAAFADTLLKLSDIVRRGRVCDSNVWFVVRLVSGEEAGLMLRFPASVVGLVPEAEPKSSFGMGHVSALPVLVPEPDPED